MAKGVAKLVEKARLGRRSWLYRWLYAHHAELAPVLSAARPPWSALVETIRADPDWSGAEDGPARQAVMGTWRRVAADVGKLAVQNQCETKPRQSDPPTQTPPPRQSTFVTPTDYDEPKPSFRGIGGKPQ